MNLRLPFFAAVAALFALAAASLVSTAASAAQVNWDSVPAILARIQAPVFPARDFPITDFGAAPGGADCTEAIAKAIAAAHAAGGGRVVVPKGVFHTGAIHLKSRVNLHVSADATLKFIPDPKKYPLVFTRWEGVECLNYSALIYAFEQQDIGITGAGTLDKTKAEILAVPVPLGLAGPHEQPFALGPPRPEVNVLIDAATSDWHALDPPGFPPGLPYPQPRDEPIRFRAEVMEPGEDFDQTGFELPPAPQLAPANSGQGELFGDDYAQTDAADGEPVFWSASGGENYPDEDFVQADAPE